MSITLRLATIDDVPALRLLIDASVRGLSQTYYTQRQIESALVYMFGVDTQLIIDCSYFVAESDNRIIGSGGWSKRATLFGGDQYKGDTPDALLDPSKDAARIRAFYVHPDWARKGVGSLILDACENAARDAGFKVVELAATLPGEPLYSAKGYTRLEYLETPLADGVMFTGYRMVKQLVTD